MYMMIDSVIMQITGADIQSLVWSVIALVTALTAIGAVIEKFIQTHPKSKSKDMGRHCVQRFERDKKIAADNRSMGIGKSISLQMQWQ